MLLTHMVHFCRVRGLNNSLKSKNMKYSLEQDTKLLGLVCSCFNKRKMALGVQLSFSGMFKHMLTPIVI